MGRDNRGGKGKGRGPPNRGKGKGNNSSNKKQPPPPPKLIFTPMEMGKPHKTYASVLEGFQNYVQKNYNMDVSKSINKLEKIDLEKLKPKRVTETELFSKDEAKRQLAESLQTGHDIEYQASIEEHKLRVRELETGLYRAYGDLRSDKWMSKTMRDRLDGHADKDKLEDNVIDTLIAMRELMQAPQRSQYPFKTLTNALTDLLKSMMDRRNDEDLIDWLGRHKQCIDVVKSIMGTRLLDGFVERLPEYQSLTTPEEKEKMKANAFEKWMVYLTLKGADQLKYGSLLDDYENQYKKIQDGKPKDEFPDTRRKAIDILSDHKFDPAHFKDLKDRKQQRKESERQNNERQQQKQETVLAQQ